MAETMLAVEAAEGELRCTVGEGFPEHCPHPGVYRTRWANGDDALLCVRHAAWVRANSVDLDRMANRRLGRG